MYKIIGADCREYGPVTVEQIQQWIREGRANAQTKVQAEGTTEWKALGELPEFSASFSGSGALLGGLYNYYLKLIRGQPATLGDAFAGFSSALIPLTLAHIVTGLLSGLASLCCLLPGIYLGVAWKFTLPLVIDKRLSFGEPMNLTRTTLT